MTGHQTIIGVADDTQRYAIAIVSAGTILYAETSPIQATDPMTVAQTIAKIMFPSPTAAVSITRGNINHGPSEPIAIWLEGIRGLVAGDHLITDELQAIAAHAALLETAVAH